MTLSLKTSKATRSSSLIHTCLFFCTGFGKRREDLPCTSPVNLTVSKHEPAFQHGELMQGSTAKALETRLLFFGSDQKEVIKEDTPVQW